VAAAAEFPPLSGAIVRLTTIKTPRLELVPLAGALELLVEGRRDEAERVLGIALPDWWPDRHDLGFLAFRSRQLAAEPDDRDWMPRLVVLSEAHAIIGHAGFHGKPGKNAREDPDAVELGYMIFAEQRGRGYATEVVRALVKWASDEHGVPRFIASIGPENAPSLALVRKLGFVEVGRHWDDEDGEELEFLLEV
jgi:ribosomal-protein-alanine N-acetyltransferase